MKSKTVQQAAYQEVVEAKHSASAWAQTVGGILLVDGYTNFLSNQTARKTADDPVREAIAILGTARPERWLRAGEWADVASSLGLIKRLVPPGDHDTAAGRERGIGKVLSAHREEMFDIETESERFKLRLTKTRKRLDGEEAKTYYCFKVLQKETLPDM